MWSNKVHRFQNPQRLWWPSHDILSVVAGTGLPSQELRTGLVQWHEQRSQVQELGSEGFGSSPMCVSLHLPEGEHSPEIFWNFNPLCPSSK